MQKTYQGKQILKDILGNYSLVDWKHSKPAIKSGKSSYFQTTSVNVQDFIESRVEKRTKGVYVPIGGKWQWWVVKFCIIYLILDISVYKYYV